MSLSAETAKCERKHHFSPSSLCAKHAGDSPKPLVPRAIIEGNDAARADFYLEKERRKKNTHTHTLTHSPTHPPTHSLTHSPHSAGGFCVVGAALVLCKLSDVRPGVPLPATFAWQVWDLARCKGSLGLRRSAGGVCVAGAALGALPRSRMYTLVSPGLPPLCRWLLRGRRSTWSSAKGSDVRPGVPWSPPLCRWRLRDRRGNWCSEPWSLPPALPRGRMYALAALPVAFAWQVRRTWCTAKGSDVRPGVPCSPPPCLWNKCYECAARRMRGCGQKCFCADLSELFRCPSWHVHLRGHLELSQTQAQDVRTGRSPLVITKLRDIS